MSKHHIPLMDRVTDEYQQVFNALGNSAVPNWARVANAADRLKREAALLAEFADKQEPE